jgi:hypothetical protein
VQSVKAHTESSPVKEEEEEEEEKQGRRRKIQSWRSTVETYNKNQCGNILQEPTGPGLILGFGVIIVEASEYEIQKEKNKTR